MAGESGIKNRRGELQRVLSQEESYVDGKLSHAAFISIAILTFITFVGNFTQLQLSSALPIIVSEFHISVTTGQWLTSVFQLVMGVMVPLTAFLTRRFSRSSSARWRCSHSAPCWHGWGQTSYGCWSGACSKLPAQA